jgi:flagellar biosynthetic protein FliR
MNDALRVLGINADWTFIFNVGTLIMLRFVMITSIIPFLVGKPVPGMIRLGFSLIMTVFLFPYLAPEDASIVPKAPMALFLLYFKEAFYGVAIGIAASIVFHAFEAAGGVVDNQRGAAQARLLIPQLGEQTTIFGTLNFQFGIVIFLSIGGHLYFFKTLIESYDVLPLFELPKHRIDMLAMADQFIRDTGSVLVTAIQLTAPILISIFVTDVVLGIMSKSAPAINVYELGFAIRGILGVVIYFLALGIAVTQMGKISMGMIGMVQKVIDYLARGAAP